MSVLAPIRQTADAAAHTSGPLLGTAAPSPAGPVDSIDHLHTPPGYRWPRPVQSIAFGRWQTAFMFHGQRRFGDVWSGNCYVRGRPTLTSHPDHVRSLMTANPEIVPSLAIESVLAPVLGPTSTLIANEPRHLPQRKLLLPPFHGEAIARYQAAIADAAEREIDRWPIGQPFALAPRMQKITLDVIMAGIFGIEGRPAPGTVEFKLRRAIRGLVAASTWPGAKIAELMNLGHERPWGIHWAALLFPNRAVHALIEKRRQEADLEERTDIMSLIIRARTEDGRSLTDEELRDELMTLVLAGHETTANQLAWAWERLVRTPAAHARLVETIRGSDSTEADEVIEQTIWEAMRARPVIPVTGRRPTVPWQLGEYGVPAGTPLVISILLLHHREDLYPAPFAFRPDRWAGTTKPGTYEWLPFGGGTRRCLGATLAMAEMRVVLKAMARRLDIAQTDRRGEGPLHRNVTMIPNRGARVVIRARRP